MAAPLHVVMPRSRALDWACAAMILQWGVTLLFPGNTLQSSPAYGFLLEITGESTWASIFLAIGILRVAALLINGHWKEGSPVLRGMAAIMGAMVWSLFLAGSVDVSIARGVLSVGVGVNLVLLGADIFSAARAGADTIRARQIAHGVFRRG